MSLCPFTDRLVPTVLTERGTSPVYAFLGCVCVCSALGLCSFRYMDECRWSSRSRGSFFIVPPWLSLRTPAYVCACVCVQRDIVGAPGSRRNLPAVPFNLGQQKRDCRNLRDSKVRAQQGNALQGVLYQRTKLVLVLTTSSWGRGSTYL